MSHAAVVKVARNDQTSSACSSVAVDEDTLTHLIEAREVLADHEDKFIVGACQILPKPIECCDSVRLKLLGVVRESNFIDDAVSTECMLTRLLQIDDHSDFEIEQLLHYIVLAYQSRAGALRPYQFVLDHVGMKACDDRLSTLSPILALTALAEAERALEAVHARKFLLLDELGRRIVCKTYSRSCEVKVGLGTGAGHLRLQLGELQMQYRLVLSSFAFLVWVVKVGASDAHHALQSTLGWTLAGVTASETMVLVSAFFNISSAQQRLGVTH